MAGVIIGPEMSGSNKKLSYDLGEYKKLRFLNFWKFAQFVSKLLSSEPIA